MACMIEKTEKVPFIEMLEMSFDSQLSDKECEAFNVSYEEFIDIALRPYSSTP